MTGATGGIGAGDRELLLAEGATVHLTDLDPERGRALVATLGDRARFHVLDVTDEAGWAAVTERIEESDGPLTTLVNCAGAALKRPLVDTSLSDFRRLVELNLTGTFLGLRAAGAAPGRRWSDRQHLLAQRRAADRRARGVRRLQGRGVRADPGRGTRVRRHAASRVNAVCPGSIDTEITDAPTSPASTGTPTSGPSP